MPLDKRSYGRMRFLRGGNFSQSLAHDIDLAAYVKYLEIRTEGSKRDDIRDALFNLIKENSCDELVLMSLVHWPFNDFQSSHFLTYQCQDQGIQQCDYSRRFPHMKNQSQSNEFEDWRTGGIERKLYLHRKLPEIPIPGDRAVAHEAADEVEHSG